MHIAASVEQTNAPALSINSKGTLAVPVQRPSLSMGGIKTGIYCFKHITDNDLGALIGHHLQYRPGALTSTKLVSTTIDYTACILLLTTRAPHTLTYVPSVNKVITLAFPVIIAARNRAADMDILSAGFPDGR